MQDKYIDPNCAVCKEDDNSRVKWSENCGTVKDWIDNLQGCNTVADCINWWEATNNIRWNREDNKRLTSAYVSYLANVVSWETWVKPLSNRLIPSRLVA